MRSPVSGTQSSALRRPERRSHRVSSSSSILSGARQTVRSPTTRRARLRAIAQTRRASSSRQDAVSLPVRIDPHLTLGSSSPTATTMPSFDRTSGNRARPSCSAHLSLQHRLTRALPARLDAEKPEEGGGGGPHGAGHAAGDDAHDEQAGERQRRQKEARLVLARPGRREDGRTTGRRDGENRRRHREEQEEKSSRRTAALAALRGVRRASRVRLRAAAQREPRGPPRRRSGRRSRASRATSDRAGCARSHRP